MDRQAGGSGGGDQPPGGNYPPPQNYPPPGYAGGQGGYPGGYGRPTPPGPAPENNLVMAIISIFCCWPLAIPAIIFATQVQGKWAMGDIAGAQDSANKARTFSLIAIILGLSWVVLWLLLVFVFGVSFFSFGFTTFGTPVPRP